MRSKFTRRLHTLVLLLITLVVGIYFFLEYHIPRRTRDDYRPMTNDLHHYDPMTNDLPHHDHDDTDDARDARDVRDVREQDSDSEDLTPFVLPRPDCTQNLLVYECTNTSRDCCGLSDRLRGIISLFLVAILTNRTFVIKHTNPCPLSNFVEPNIYNWSKCLSYVDVGSPDYVYLDGMGPAFPELSTIGKSDIWKARVVAITTNVILNEKIREHPRANLTMPWIFHGMHGYTTHLLFHVLFKLTKTFDDQVYSFIKQITLDGAKELIGVHLRKQFIYEEDYQGIFRHLQAFDKPENVLYISTEDTFLRDYATRHIRNSVSLNVSDVTLKVYRRTADCESLHLALLEQHILARSETLIKSRSGFSEMACFIRGRRCNVKRFTHHPVRLNNGTFQASDFQLL